MSRAQNLFDEAVAKLAEKLRGLGYEYAFDGTGLELMMTVIEDASQVRMEAGDEWKIVALLDVEQGVIWNIPDGITVDDKLLGTIRRGFLKLCGYWQHMEHETLLRLNAGA